MPAIARPLGCGIAILMGAFVALAGACGETTAEERIRGTLDQAWDALAAGDYDRLCELTTRTAQRHVGYAGHQPPEGCRRDMRQFVRMVTRAAGGAPPRPDIDRVDVGTGRAEAFLTTPAGAIARVPLIERDGQWRLDALYGGVSSESQEDKF